MGRLAEVGQFGVDGAQAGVLKHVVNVPLEASVEFGAKLLKRSFAAADLVSAFRTSSVNWSISSMAEAFSLQP